MTWRSVIICVGLIGLFASCRSEEDVMRKSNEREVGIGGEAWIPTLDDQLETAPDTWREPPRLDYDDALPAVLRPTDDVSGNTEYATDVHMATFPKGSSCIEVVATAARNEDGDFFEVYAPFEWFIGNAAATGLNCATCNNQSFCAMQTDNGLLPKITACAVNDCPEPRPTDCADLICRSVSP